MGKVKYYGVAGSNGYGVYNDYDRVLESRIHIKKFRNKKFDNFEDAKRWATDTFYEIQNDFFVVVDQVEIESLNWFYRVKKK